MALSAAPQPFSLRQLQYAVAVADALSFRKAADRCHVSQPSLSAQLAQLEAVLGVRLFERDRRRVLISTAGHDILERARRVLVEADALRDVATRARDPLAGTLRIGVIPTLSPYLLPDLTPVLRSEYPRLTILWVEDKTDALVRSLAAGTLDAALLALEADLGVVEAMLYGVHATDPLTLVTVVITLAAADSREGADDGNHLAELIRAIPCNGEGGNSAGAGAHDGVHFGVGVNVVGLHQFGEQFIADDLGIARRMTEMYRTS